MTTNNSFTPSMSLPNNLHEGVKGMRYISCPPVPHPTNNQAKVTPAKQVMRAVLTGK